ncbi:hypothetical protein D0863_03602 [Hortaea werneckii]|uniref:Enoyl reductase (ER) domain-containing protein n=1 Tax=Hortaea werneckii TaxID=91943 RepID=A0A3M7EBB9_HORWE|nr:hypothetical protein D0863_03602 [Hortaea werneckii]
MDPSPVTMRAVLQPNSRAPTLTLTTVPVPEVDLTAGEHLIRVHATSPCKGELDWWRMVETMDLSLPASKQFIPCFDLAGTVVKGPTNSPFQPGEAVFARTNAFRTGNAAEYAVALTKELAKKPQNLSWVEAASVSLSALTAYQALFQHGGLDVRALEGEEEARKGNGEKRLLVTAASGGVGSWTLQLAREAGVKDIIAVCSTDNVDMVACLGATETIDYRKTTVGAWMTAAGEQLLPDIILDCVGGETLSQCWLVAKAGGKLMSIVAPPDTLKPEGGVREGVKGVFFIMDPNGEQLQVIAKLIEGGRCKPIVDSVYALEDFQEAFNKVEAGHAKGKVVITLT